MKKFDPIALLAGFPSAAPADQASERPQGSQPEGPPAPADVGLPAQKPQPRAHLSRRELLASFGNPNGEIADEGVPRRGRRTNHAGEPVFDLPDLPPEPSDAAAGAAMAGAAGEGSAAGHSQGNLQGKNRRGRRRPDREGGIGSVLEDDEELAEISRELAGSNDRAHYLAMAAAVGNVMFRMPRMGAQSTLPQLRPTSRAECERRCGTDGFCDPSSPLGCGGEYCGNRNILV